MSLHTALRDLAEHWRDPRFTPTGEGEAADALVELLAKHVAPPRARLTDSEHEEIWLGLQRIRPAGPDAPLVSLLQPDDKTHALWAVAPAVESLLAARERALREEIAGQIEADLEAAPTGSTEGLGWHRANRRAARIARGEQP